MKPVSLRFKNFGPFREEQTIDFTKFEKSGLFLIYGNTGSGKTTILDAMCCALFCESSNGSRFGKGASAIEKMRCQQADPKEETFVEYIFDSNDHRYRFFRKTWLNRGGTNFNHTDSCGEYDGTDFVPFEPNLTMEKVSDYAKKIIGLNANQFRQVVILPQGKFEELLTSETKDKEPILTGIFNADKWDDITKNIKTKIDEEARKLSNEKVAIESELRRYDCADIDSLRDLLKQKESAASENISAEKQLRTEIKILEEKDRELQKLDVSFNDCDRKKNKLKQLTEELGKSSLTETKIHKGESALKIKPDHDQMLEALRLKKTAELELSKSKSDFEAAEKTLVFFERAKESHEGIRDFVEKRTSLAVTLETKRTAYEGISQKKKALTEAVSVYDNTCRKEISVRTAYEASVTALEKASEKMKKADAELTNARMIYDRNISGILAKSLENNKPCPVCGSTSHPSPAHESSESITKKELEAAEEARDLANNTYKEVQKSTESRKVELDQATKQKTDATFEKVKAEMEYASVKRNMEDGIDSLDELNAKIDNLNSEKAAYEKKEKELTAAYTEASDKRSRLKGILESAESKYKEAENKYSVTAKKWETVLAESEFTDEKDFICSVIDPDELNSLKEKLIALNTDYKTALEEYNTVSEALKDSVRPDLAASKKTIDEKQRIHSAAVSKIAVLNKEIDDITITVNNLEMRTKLYGDRSERNSKNQQFVNMLSGSSSVSLKRYVLGTMLDLVTEQANVMLNSVYGGRYRIERTTDKTGRSRIAGLSFEILDQQCDSKRSATDISGGEKFLISLSLAIGLSNVVRAQGSGVNLEAIFVDEGFGTLDKHCLNDAMYILQTVKNQNGMVGVISHVDELAETIPAKIQTIKSDSGNRCEFHYE